MAVVDATVGGATANSYQTLAEITTYADAHLYGEKWLLADIPHRSAAAIQATRLMEQLIRWGGAKATEIQALSQPRTGLLDRYGQDIAQTVIAKEVKEAHAEFCLFLLSSNRLTDEMSGVSSITTPTMSLTLNSNERGEVIPPIVSQMVGHLGSVASSRPLQVRVMRI